MSTVICFTRPDGGVTVVAPCGQREGETERQWLDRVRAKSVPKDATNVHECDGFSLPRTRRFRNAWENDGKAVAVSMVKARVLRMTEIRAERDKRLKETDGPAMRAMERQTPDLETLKAKRQALRDLPANVNLDAILTPEALAAFEPEWPA